MGFDEAEIDAKTDILKERYFSYLEREVYARNPIQLPGTSEILASLKKRKDVILGLLTGNFLESARIKLERFDLFKFFEMGAYGDDATTRNGLPAVAQQRIREARGMDIPFRDIVIIGDTVHDIACAQSVGAISVAVGTGWTAKEVLLMHCPDIFFESLADTDTVIQSMLDPQ
jgi:phosphoglycolate phosphatase-like HAD superfamily hydrolase